MNPHLNTLKAAASHFIQFLFSCHQGKVGLKHPLSRVDLQKLKRVFNARILALLLPAMLIFSDSFSFVLPQLPENIAKAGNGSAPLFEKSNYVFNVQENISPGSFAGNVTARDADGDQISYSVIAGNTNNTLSLESASGNIILKKVLNHHFQDEYNLIVRATDQTGLYSEAAVSIKVQAVDSIPGFQTLTWSTAAPQPMGTHEVLGEVVHGKLYIFGGYNPSKRPAYIPTPKSFVYDPATDKWSSIADLPHTPSGVDFGGITHEGMATDGTDIYMAGGYTANSSGTGQIFGTKQVYRYNVAQNTYTVLPSLPISLASGQLRYLKGKLHFIGGANSSRQDVGVHYALDLDNLPAGWKTLAPLNNPRNHGGSAVFGEKIYFIGGAHGHDDQSITQSDVDAYDDVNDAWTKVANLPVPRDHISSAVTVVGNRILVLGGKQSHTKLLNLVSAFSPANNQWEDLTPLPATIASGVAGFLHNALHYTGGGFYNINRKANISAISVSQKVTDLLLINADNNQVIKSIADNDEINLASLPTKNINIQAITSPDIVGSVKFDLTGTENKTVIESISPYALFGDDKNGNFNSWTPAPGSYNLIATPYTSSGAGGSSGISLSKKFTVTNNSVQAIVLNPVADSYVRDGNYADENYGSEGEVLVKGSPNKGFTRNSFFKFNLGGITDVSDARLRVYGKNIANSSAIAISCFSVLSDTWEEQKITFNNQPSVSVKLSQVMVNDQLGYYEFDVTDFVKEQIATDKILSLALQDLTNADKIISFNSKENSINRPELIISGNSSTNPGTAISLNAMADAMIRDGAYASKNYGDDTSLLVKSSPNGGFSRESYLKFSLSGVPKVGKAKLRVYGSNISNSSGVTVGCHGLDNDSWTEQTLTWNTAPASLATVLGSSLVTNQRQYYEFDVTNYVRSQLNGDKIVSLVLKDVNNADKILQFNSKENPQNRPQLIIITDSVGGSTGVTTFNTLADASVRDGSYSSKNYGSDGTLLIKGSPNAGFTRHTYLRFGLTGLTTVGTAKVRIYGSNTSGSKAVTVTGYGVDNDTWSENSINWTTAPPPQSTAQGEVIVTNQKQYYEIDVTGYVKSQLSGDKVVSLLLKDAGNADNILEFNSKENGQYPPQLVVTDGGQTLTTYSRLNFQQSISEVNIYPNPVNSGVYIDFPATNDEKFTINVIGALGEFYGSKTIWVTGNNQPYYFDLSQLHLKPGVYFLSIFSGNGKKQVFKILKGS